MAHILVVEDNPVVRMLAELHLESAGHTVMTASNGDEALQLVSVIRPDLILSDLNMPNLDGFGLLRAVRERQDLASVPVIFLTMHDDMDRFRLSTELGANDYLNKPINRNALLNSINKCLSAARNSGAQQAPRVSLSESEEIPGDSDQS